MPSHHSDLRRRSISNLAAAAPAVDSSATPVRSVSPLACEAITESTSTPSCTSPAEYERSARFCSGPAQTAGARGA